MMTLRTDFHLEQHRRLGLREYGMYAVAGLAFAAAASVVVTGGIPFLTDKPAEKPVIVVAEESAPVVVPQ